MLGGQSIVFTHKAVVEKTFIRKSTNLCKSIVSNDASQLYLHSICEPMPTGLHTRWDLDTETCRFTPRQSKSRSFEFIAIFCFQRMRPDCKIESFYTTGWQKKNECFSVDGLCSHCNTVFEAMECLYRFCPQQEVGPSLTEENNWSGTKEKELDELRRNYIQEKGTTVIEIWECEWCRLYETDTSVQQHLREKFPYRRSLAEYKLLEEINSGNVFSVT